MSILKVSELEKSYRTGFFKTKQKVLTGVSFSLEPGRVTGFLGGNGAGKTTTMKCILGLAFPDDGEIRFFGDNKLSTQIKSKIGFLPERPYFYDYLTGEEFLTFYAQLSARLSKAQIKDKINSLLARVDLEHARNKPLRGYSKGMLQKIGLAQALIHDPEFVILDEPMAGLDPDGRFYLSELIKETAKNGTSIFLSSHLLNDVEKLCEDLVILTKGEVAYQGSTKNLLSNINTLMTIYYIENDKINSREVKKGQELQNAIDELRKSNLEIRSISENAMSLEKAFVDLTMNASKMEA